MFMNFPACFERLYQLLYYPHPTTNNLRIAETEKHRQRMQATEPRRMNSRTIAAKRWKL